MVEACLSCLTWLGKISRELSLDEPLSMKWDDFGDKPSCG